MTNEQVVAGQPVQVQGGLLENQSAGDSKQVAGGNFADQAELPHPTLYMVESFQGRSGQPDNQDTNRPKGSI